MLGQEPPDIPPLDDHRALTLRASDQAMNLPASPLPSTTRSYSSGRDMFFPEEFAG